MLHVVECAKEIYSQMPTHVIESVKAKPFRGEIITTSQTYEMASLEANDIKTNVVFLKPIVKRWPSKVCSGYLYADVILYLDVLLGGNLLTPVDGNTKRSLALVTGGLIKNLWGA